jgi:hypothetical protein
MEKKSFFCGLEIKSLDGDANSQIGTFSGWASVWDSVDLGGDMIRRGAYRNTLARWSEKGQMPQMLFYHDMREVIGEWTKMMEDEKGLYVEGKLWVSGDMRVESAVKAYNILRANSVKGLSIGFYDRGSEERQLVDGTSIRELQEIDLLEVSIAPFAMEPKAMVTSVKSLTGENGQLASKRECEKALRDAGLSARQAKAFISGGYDAMTRDESAPQYAEILASLDRLSTILKGAKQ